MRLTRQQTQLMTRERLRSAGAQQFAQKGVEGSSIDSIAEAAGFSRGAFYSNYKAKQDLVLELLEEAKKTELSIWQDLVDQSPDLDTVMPLLKARIDDFMGRESRLLLTIELRLHALRNQEFREAYARSMQTVLGTTTSLMRSIAEKAGKPQLDAEAIAIGLRALWIGLAVNFADTEGGHSRSDIVSAFLNSVFNQTPILPSGNAVKGGSKA